MSIITKKGPKNNPAAATHDQCHATTAPNMPTKEAITGKKYDNKKTKGKAINHGSPNHTSSPATEAAI